MNPDTQLKLSSARGDDKRENLEDIIVLGGGIAGLSVAYHLSKLGCDSFGIYEAEPVPGGLARSFSWHNIDCDLAPHRLYSDDQSILDELLGLVECNRVQRRSKIVLGGRWIKDPINIVELLKVNLPFRSIRLVASYIAAKFNARGKKRNFDEFVVNTYGNALNKLFFRPYAEKLLGIESQQISAAWGYRKLRVSGVREVLRKDSRLYFKQFYYPAAGGYGAFASKLAAHVGDRLHNGMTLEKLVYNEAEKFYECHFRDKAGQRLTRKSPMVVSTLPLTRLMTLLGSPVALNYRPMRLVYIQVNRPKVMDEQWIYFVDQSIMINRVSEFKNFYPDHPEQDTTVLCAEVTMRNDCSGEDVVGELERLEILFARDVLDIKLIDLDKAYPVYDTQYERNLERVGEKLKAYPNLVLLGRQAEFAHQDIDEIFGRAKEVAATCLQSLTVEQST